MQNENETKRVCPNCGQLIPMFPPQEATNNLPIFYPHKVMADKLIVCSMSYKQYKSDAEQLIGKKIKLRGVPKILKPEHLLQDGRYFNKDKTKCCVQGWLYNNVNANGALLNDCFNALVKKIETYSIAQWNDKTNPQEVCNVFNSVFEGDKND